MLIACLHVPRFAVEVERQRRPDIAARLILIGDATVLDCSLGAQTTAVCPGMRMSEAIALCQQALVLPPDLPHYQRRFEEMLDFLEDYSPAVQGEGSGHSLGTAYLSLDGLPLKHGPFSEQIIAALHRRLGLMASLGIAAGKFAARVAARITRPGLAKIVPPGEEAAFLAPLSIDHLTYGVAPAGDTPPLADWRLRLLGLETMGDIASFPLGAFQAQFGPEGKRCWELANGIDNEPLLPRVREETIVQRLQMPAPTAALEAILAGLERLLYAAYACPERSTPEGVRSRRGNRKGRWVRKAVVRATLDGGGAWELPVPFREALADPAAAWFAVKSAIARRPPERPVEELEVELVGLSAESGKQASMFEGKGKLWQQVEEAARQLHTQHKQLSLGRVLEVEPWSRIPERRAALVDFDPSARR